MTASLNGPPFLYLNSAPFECVEIYIPKQLENLAKLYTFLQSKLVQRKEGIHQEAPIDGFSLYEVDGAFFGHEIYQERTIVIRILFNRSEDEDSQSLARKISVLGREVATSVALHEEELWMCHYPQGVMIFRPQSEGPKASAQESDPSESDNSSISQSVAE